MKLIVDCPDESDAFDDSGESNNKIKLNEVCGECKVQPFTDEEFRLMGEYVTIMTPLSHALDVLQGENGNSITIGHLLPAIVVIRQAINNIKDKGSLEFCEPLASAISSGLEKRFGSFFKDDDVLLSSAIHPKFKTLSWLEEKDEEEKKVIDKIFANFKKRLIALKEKENEKNPVVTIYANGLKPLEEQQKDFFAPLKKNEAANAQDPAVLEIAKFNEKKGRTT